MDLPKQVTLEAQHFDTEGFRLIVKDYQGATKTFDTYRISFSTPPFAMRMIDEGDYLNSVGVVEGWLLKVENSEFLSWFHDESQGVRMNQNLTHYAIYCLNECFDILHADEPIISKLF
jgi:hypothetical protein